MCKFSQKKKDYASMKDKVVIITGASHGIGEVSTEEIAKKGATVIMATRNEEKTRPILERIQKEYPESKLDFIPLDLSDLDSVAKFTDTFKQRYNQLHVLLNNAGIMNPPTRQESKQGFELQMATNHFGHFVLTNRLMDILKQTPESRVVNVASIVGNDGWMQHSADINFKDLQHQENYIPEVAYCQSKLANILFTKQLNQVIKSKGYNMKTVSLHPGVVDTGLFDDTIKQYTGIKKLIIKIFTKSSFITKEDGAKTNIHCSLEKYEDLKSGEYYDKCKTKKVSKRANDPQLAQELWDVSNQLTQSYLQEW